VADPRVAQLQEIIKREGMTPDMVEATGLMVRFGAASPQDFQVQTRGPLSAGEQALGIAESFPKGIATTAIGLSELATGAAQMLSPFAADLAPQAGDFTPAREALDESLGFTPGQLQELPTPVAGGARAAQIGGETLLPGAAVLQRGRSILTTTSRSDLFTLGFIKRAFVDAARNPKKFIAIEGIFSAGAGVGGDAVAKNFGEESRVFGELSSAFGLPFAIGIFKTVKSAVKATFGGLSQQQAEDLVGVAIMKELEKNPEFAKALQESQALQGVIKGFKLDLVKATRSPSINRAANEIEFDPSKLNIENRTAVDNFGKKLQAEFGRLDEATGEVVSDVIQAGPSQSGFPRAEILTAEAFKSQVTKIVDDELGAVQTQMAKLEQEFIAGASRPTGDRFEAGEDAFEKFLNIRGRADTNIKTIYRQLTGDLVLPRQSFRTMPKAYQRALKVDAAGNKPPPEVEAMVKKMRGSFRSTGKGTTTEIGFDVVLGTTKKRVGEVIDSRVNTFGAVRELRSELGSKAAQAAKAGDRPLARRYNILLAEMNRVLDNAATQGNLPLKQSNLLSEGNRLRRNFAKMFEDFEGRALFAKTNQSQMKVAYEDTLNIMIKPNTAKRSITGIDNMKRIYGDSPATQELIKYELLRRMQVVGETNGVLTTRGFARFKQQYSNAINRAGLKEDFATIEQATKTFEDNLSALGQSRKQIENSVLAHVTQADNPRNFIETALKDRPKFQELVAAAQRTDPTGEGSFKIFKAAVMETITNSTLTKQLAAGTETIPVLSGKLLDEMLVVNGDEIKLLLGNQHFVKLQSLQKALARSDPARLVLRGGAPPASSQNINQTKIQTVFSLVRQIEQRVLSIQFVATNLTINNLLAMKSKVLRDVWRLTMSDIDFAARIAREARSNANAGVVRSLFTPGLGIAVAEADVENPGAKTQGFTLKELKATLAP